MREFGLVVIGAGPGGYVAALRAAQLGLTVAVVEKDVPGGTCVAWGCIPTKAILSSAAALGEMRRAGELGLRCDGASADYPAVQRRSREIAARMSQGVSRLLKKGGVELVAGRAVVAAPHVVRVGTEELFGRTILVATGSAPRGIPGFEPDGRFLLGSDDALALGELPRSVAVLGGGAVGVEFAHAWNAFGSEVTVVEMADQLLPRVDAEVARELGRSLARRGIRVRTGAAASSFDRERGVLALSANGKDEAVPAEKVLVAVGRRPATEGLGLEEQGVRLERGYVVVDREYRTACPSILAVGDAIGGMMLAHEASAEGVAAAEVAAGRAPSAPVDRDRVPACVYCEPEVAVVGLSEEEARRRGLEVRTGRAPFSANGRAVAGGRTEGFVKVVAEAKYGQVVGVHAIGHGASELVGEASLGISLEATLREFGSAVHAHPTLSETLREAARAAAGESIDL